MVGNIYLLTYLLTYLLRKNPNCKKKCEKQGTALQASGMQANVLYSRNKKESSKSIYYVIRD